MRRIATLLPFVFLLILSLGGCSKKSTDGQPVQMHWDRDMCERCKMAVSERKYAVQVINMKNGKAYKFDDIGCAVLWFKEEKIPWKDQAKIWITDAKTGKWIDARTAKYTDDSITPMAYGFAAYTDKTFPKGHQVRHYDDVVKTIFKIEALNNEKLGGTQ
jgi:nitrous oxide reductase accessory protein NosL